MAATNCPGRAELEGFVAATLAGSEFARVADHVERCPDCEEALQALDRLRRPVSLPTAAVDRVSRVSEAEPVPRELVAVGAFGPLPR